MNSRSISTSQAWKVDARARSVWHQPTGTQFRFFVAGDPGPPAPLNVIATVDVRKKLGTRRCTTERWLMAADLHALEVAGAQLAPGDVVEAGGRPRRMCEHAG